MLKYLAGPLIGAVIGYFTNYIAVKMLFRPREAKYIFGHRIPLTPGAIPKGKARLAKSAGEVVSNYLVTEEDIGAKFMSGSVEEIVVNKTMLFLNTEIKQDISALARTEANFNLINDKIDTMITNKVIDAVSNADVDRMMSTNIRRAIMKKLSGSFLGMVVSENKVDSIVKSLSKEIIQYVQEHGQEKIKPIVSAKMSEIREKSILDLLYDARMDETMVKDLIREAYRSAITVGVAKIVQHMDIAGIIEQKINEMTTVELERIVLQVMDRELKMIVNLGALIGLVIGCINIFV